MYVVYGQVNSLSIDSMARSKNITSYNSLCSVVLTWSFLIGFFIFKIKSKSEIINKSIKTSLMGGFLVHLRIC